MNIQGERERELDLSGSLVDQGESKERGREREREV